MQDAAGSGRAVKQRRGRRLGVGDEFLEVVRRHRIVGKQQQRHIGADRDRHEIVEIMPRALGKQQRRRGGGKGDVVKQQRMAVGRGLGDLIGADRAAATADILDDKALPHGLGQAIGDQPRQQVGGGAGRERHHDPHRAARKCDWPSTARRERRPAPQQAMPAVATPAEDFTSCLGHSPLPFSAKIAR